MKVKRVFSGLEKKKKEKKTSWFIIILIRTPCPCSLIPLTYFKILYFDDIEIRNNARDTMIKKKNHKLELTYSSSASRKKKTSRRREYKYF